MSLPDFLSGLLTPAAHAATPGATAQTSNSSFFIMMAALLFLMYFMIWRPQSRRAREQRELITALAKGDEVITAGGMLGTITKVTDGHIRIALADGVEVLMQKSSVTSVLPKGTLKSI